MQITQNAPSVGKGTILKQAAFIRGYGASELMLATMTGQYPPPHNTIDDYVMGQLEFNL